VIVSIPDPVLARVFLQLFAAGLRRRRLRDLNLSPALYLKKMMLAKE
jgi:hypothetical protein